MNNNAVFYDYIKRNATCLYFLIDKQGVIKETNEYTNNFFGKNTASLLFKDVIVDFTDRFKLDEINLTEKYIINVSGKYDIPSTFYFYFYKHGNDYIAIGESNVKEVEDLQKNMLEINAELNNLGRELQKKNKELGKLSSEKSKLLGIAAHDLRNPITIIWGYSDFFLDNYKSSLTEDQLLVLETIRDTSKFMHKLLNDLLDFSAIETGKLVLNKTKEDIVDIVNTNIKLNRIVAGKKDINIVLDSHEIIPEIELDRTKIEQVLSNLLSNAIKFSNPGTTIKLSIFLSGKYATVAVCDQGQGIPKDELNKLFKPFQKLSVKSTSNEKSTGLGLSIVRLIITGHGGKIWVESEVGVGSTFYFSIPL